MPKLGEIIRASEIGSKQKRAQYTKLIWVACIDCGKERWVFLHSRQPQPLRCRSCSATRTSKGLKRNWKGGRWQNSQGYIQIYKPDYSHTNCKGYVLEHILIWEQVHNKPLPKGWVVHHLNGVKIDNRPENLVAMPRGKHLHLAEPYKKRIRELEAKVKLLERTLETNQLIFNIGEN